MTHKNLFSKLLIKELNITCSSCQIYRIVEFSVLCVFFVCREGLNLDEFTSYDFLDSKHPFTRRPLLFFNNIDLCMEDQHIQIYPNSRPLIIIFISSINSNTLTSTCLFGCVNSLI